MLDSGGLPILTTLTSDHARGIPRDMNERQFWNLMEGLKPSDRAGDLKNRLARLTTEEIVAFQSRFDGTMNRAYDNVLWAAASLMCKGWCSDDMFEYFRAGLIARGERVFTDALANPDSMAKWAEPGCWVSEEPVIYAASQVYEELTGTEMEFPDPTESWSEKGDASLMASRRGWKRAFPALHKAFMPSVRLQDRELRLSGKAA